MVPNLLLLLSLFHHPGSSAWIRINQLGYPEGSVKVAVLVSKGPVDVSGFELYDALTGEQVYRTTRIRAFGAYAAFSHSWRLDFSDFRMPGAYFVQAGGVRSPVFRIDDGVYDGTADFLLQYMRQQRSGYNPFLRDSCHTEDGFVLYHPDPAKDSTYLDVAGGWHDASDYLQYLPTSANAVLQMLFAYRENPESFGDEFDAAGLPGGNGIPDILDEVKWGLDWMQKMNPAPGEYYNQLADDRDHLKMRLPTEDSILYAPDRGFSRPVYFINGRPQGVMRYQNRTTGVSSSAGKFASAFALGNEVLAPFFPDYAAGLLPRALDAYRFGQSRPGVTQTAPCRAPYFYEEDNWTDDMELAAVLLHGQFPGQGLLDEAVEYGRAEPVTPWMGADTARHYQWYPFMNMGHYFLAARPEGFSSAFSDYLRQGIDRVWQRGRDNPFLFGVPFIWCSNNLVTALLTQCRLYGELTGDTTYAEMEAALRDWLFGCNPWGTSMICGLPQEGVSPRDPHSAFTHLYQYPIDGGLVDGPVYGSIWSRLIGIRLYEPDEFAEFQSGLVVYHDDYGDYSTNEPTMDGTACLTYYLSGLQKDGHAGKPPVMTDMYGAVIRGDVSEKTIRLIFTGHEFAGGARTIERVLEKHGIRARFFFTGDFLRQYPNVVKRLRNAGHYIGAHSDKHLLYCDWDRRDSLLVTRDSFLADLKANYRELARLGIARSEAPLFIAPYEWYNATIAQWCRDAGLTLVNFTPGIGSNADYTWPGLPNYRNNTAISDRILQFEAESANGLNGAYLLLHIGADPRRPDPFYRELDGLIGYLKGKGYGFLRQ